MTEEQHRALNDAQENVKRLGEMAAKSLVDDIERIKPSLPGYNAIIAVAAYLETIVINSMMDTLKEKYHNDPRWAEFENAHDAYNVQRLHDAIRRRVGWL